MSVFLLKLFGINFLFDADHLHEITWIKLCYIYQALRLQWFSKICFDLHFLYYHSTFHQHSIITLLKYIFKKNKIRKIIKECKKKKEKRMYYIVSGRAIWVLHCVLTNTWKLYILDHHDSQREQETETLVHGLLSLKELYRSL